jgi:hypothetical protein
VSTIYLVHGFNVRDGGKATTGKLHAALRNTGYTVKQVSYGHVGRMGVRACNDNVAKVLASIVTKDDYVVAHSNGAAIVYDAGEFGMKSKGVFLFNPALDNKKEIRGTDAVRVFHSPSDPWTALAKWIPFSNWGNQGQVGYTGDDFYQKYRHTDNDATFGAETGHSGIFTGSLRPNIAAGIIRSDIYNINHDLKRIP